MIPNFLKNYYKAKYQVNTMASDKITRVQLDNLLDSATVEKHLFHGGKSMILSYKLPCGFTVDGRAALININEFDDTIGETVAREDAIDQLWKLEGYRKQWQLYENSLESLTN